MNFIRVQLSTLTILAMYGTMIEANQANCVMNPSDVDVSDIKSYFTF